MEIPLNKNDVINITKKHAQNQHQHVENETAKKNNIKIADIFRKCILKSRGADYGHLPDFKYEKYDFQSE